jgi:hypothetical protein
MGVTIKNKFQKKTGMRKDKKIFDCIGRLCKFNPTIKPAFCEPADI